ncbi:MAG: hypothetical protein IJV12_02305 [Acidaminococcaceae bacterium]|nr:hypothetical protein [Acidaminococcaceae bacterium]
MGRICWFCAGRWPPGGRADAASETPIMKEVLKKLVINAIANTFCNLLCILMVIPRFCCDRY